MILTDITLQLISEFIIIIVIIIRLLHEYFSLDVVSIQYHNVILPKIFSAIFITYMELYCCLFISSSIKELAWLFVLCYSWVFVDLPVIIFWSVAFKLSICGTFISYTKKNNLDLYFTIYFHWQYWMFEDLIRNR